MTAAARERAAVRVPLLIVSAAAWLMLSAAPISAHAHHAPPQGFLRWAVNWLVMLAAMMAPVLTEPVRYIRDRSLARQRARSIGLFVAGYVVVWMAAGAVLQSVAARLLAVESSIAIAVLVVVATVWQCSPVKQQSLNSGHVHPDLAPGGLAADAGALRFGVVHGVWCVGSCWALMLLLLMATRAQLAAMVCAMLWTAAERLERSAPREWRVRVPEKAVCLVYVRFCLMMPSRSAMRWASRKPELNAPSM